MRLSCDFRMNIGMMAKYSERIKYDFVFLSFLWCDQLYPLRQYCDFVLTLKLIARSHFYLFVIFSLRSRTTKACDACNFDATCVVSISLILSYLRCCLSTKKIFDFFIFIFFCLSASRASV